MRAASSNPPDRRVRRTHARLAEALIGLVAEQGFAAVTVAGLVRRASIGRSTFYAHFGDVHALHRRMLKDHLRSRRGQPHLLDSAAPFLEHARTRGSHWLGGAATGRAPQMRDQLRRTLTDVFRDELKQRRDGLRPDTREAEARALAGALTELLVWWTNAPTGLSALDVDTIFRRVAAAVQAGRTGKPESG